MISIENNGDHDARSIEIIGELPDGFIVVDQTRIPLVGSVSNVGNIYTWDFGDLAIGETASWSFNVIASAEPGVYSGLAHITASNLDEESVETVTLTTNVSDLALEGAVTDDECGSTDLGAIDIDIQSGTPPFSFSWSNGSDQEDLMGLPGGQYEVTVTDGGGCTVSAVFDVEGADMINVFVPVEEILRFVQAQLQYWKLLKDFRNTSGCLKEIRSQGLLLLPLK